LIFKPVLNFRSLISCARRKAQDARLRAGELFSILSLCHCTVVPLYRCTVVPLYHCTVVPLCRCAVVPLCRCAVVPLYRCTVVPLYRCTIVPLYRCAVVPLCRCAAVPLYRCTVALLRRYYSSRSTLCSSTHGRPCILSCSIKGSGSNSSTLKTPGFFQIPLRYIIAPIDAGTPVV
jgi:hypothetical protein